MSLQEVAEVKHGRPPLPLQVHQQGATWEVEQPGLTTPWAPGLLFLLPSHRSWLGGQLALWLSLRACLDMVVLCVSRGVARLDTLGLSCGQSRVVGGQ